MSKAELDFPEVDETELNDKQSTENQQRRKSRNTRRYAPVIIAIFLSVIWTGLTVYYLYSTPSALSQIAVTDLAALVAGYATPIAIFWLIALAFQRTDPLLERRLAMAQNLDKAISPIELAEQRIKLLNKNLRKELESIDAVADLAADRITNLENRFQEQISNLFTATADTEARTTSIRDTLEREREAIGETTQEVQERFNNLEQMVASIAAELENAGHSVATSADSAKDRVDSSLENLSLATENFETRLDKASETVTNRAEQVQDIADHVELRLHTATESALSGMERFRHDVEGLEGRSAELSEHMKTQGTVLHDLAELAATESKKIEESLKTHVGEVRLAATEALERTSDVSDMFSDKAKAMSAQVIDTVETAKGLLEEAGQSLEEHCQSALSTSEQVNEKTLSTTKATGEAVLEHAAKADDMLMHGLERAKAALEGTMSAITDHTSTAVQEAEDTANRTLHHIRQLRAGVEEQISELENTGTKAVENISATADKISEKSAELRKESEETVEELTSVSGQMNVQSNIIEDVLNETRMKLARLEDDLSSQRDALNSASNDAAEKVIQAAERFANNSLNIQNTATTVEEHLNIKSGKLVSIIDQMTETSSDASEKMGKAVTDLNNQTTDLRGELIDSGGALGKAAEAFAGERHRIKEETESVISELNRASDNMGTEVTRFTDSSMEAANRLDSASQVLMDQTQQAQEQMHKSVDETRTELSDTMEDIGNKASERITYLQEEMQATLARVLTEYQETADQAEKESALLAMRLGTEAEKINQTTEQFIAKTEDIEKRIASATKNEFARTSALLMESLQSTSIDINKALSDDLPDDVWEDYLAGDRSIFIRRTLKVGDRKSKKIINDKFQTDPEFKEAVARYCRDFEGMMERAMMGDKGSAMSVTLISSDMGKLYVLLGQALKKFS